MISRNGVFKLYRLWSLLVTVTTLYAQGPVVLTVVRFLAFTVCFMLDIILNFLPQTGSFLLMILKIPGWVVFLNVVQYLLQLNMYIFYRQLILDSVLSDKNMKVFFKDVDRIWICLKCFLFHLSLLTDTIHRPWWPVISSVHRTSS